MAITATTGCTWSGGGYVRPKAVWPYILALIIGASLGPTSIAASAVTGNREGNAALASLLTSLATAGLVNDSTTSTTDLVPNMRLTGYSQARMQEYISALSARNTLSETGTLPYAHGTGISVSGSYMGGVFSPFQNRVYGVPYLQANVATWHYIDGNTGVVVGYAHGATAVANAYDGGAFSPTQNRIYFAPHAQANRASWHYVDCNTGAVVAYTHGVTAVANAYAGAVYSPLQNRLYFVPFDQGAQTNWHYVNCATGAVVAYAHGATAVAGAYVGGVYSPTEDRIYLIPNGQASQATWHYINCATGAVVAYTHGVAAVIYAYYGGVYSPLENRIYMVPADQGPETNWHYINCSTGEVVAYAHGVTILSAFLSYDGGAYSPVENKIYFAPSEQATEAAWHGINCATGTAFTYTHTGSTAISGAYSGAVFSPVQNRVYFVPFFQSNQANWHYRYNLAGDRASSSLMGGPMFNKY